MSYVLTENWDVIQERNIDPLSPVHSDNHNRLLKILGTDKLYIDGLDYSFTHDYENNRIVMHLTPGIVVINYICVEFKENSTIIFLNANEDIRNKSFYVVVEYEFRKIRPLSIATIKVIKQEIYDPSKHLILFEFYTPSWFSLPSESEFNIWVANDSNFIDRRVSLDYLPAWLTKNFLSSAGGELGGSFIVPEPTTPYQVANKEYVDNLISHHDEEHMDYFVLLEGSSMSGKLYLSEHPDNTELDSMGSNQAATKGYVDYWADLILTNIGGGPFLQTSGGTLTGYLTLHASPVNNYHAATKLYVDSRIEEVINFSEGPFLPLNGGTMTGNLILNGPPFETNQAATKGYVDINTAPVNHTHDAIDITEGTLSGLRGIQAGSSVNSFVRYNGTSALSGTFYGGTTNPSSSQRLNYNGYFYATRVYNAVYNDYADCLYPEDNLTYEEAKNKIVEIKRNNIVGLATKESEKVIGVVSDTYAYIAGGTEEEIKNNEKIPICSSGYVWIHVINVEDAEVGFYVIPDSDGYGKVITSDEKKNFRDCIVGKIIAIDVVNKKVRISIIMN